MSSHETNRYPGRAEEAIIRQHVAADEALEPLLRKRLEQARSTAHQADQAAREAREAADAAQLILAQVEDLEGALQKRLEHYRGLLHPIRRVPDDVLRDILTAWVAAESTSGSKHAPARDTVAFTAAAISQRWRAVALTKPELWTDVRLDLSKLELGSDPRSEQAWIEYLLAHVAYSGDRLLDLVISGQTRIPAKKVDSLWRIVHGMMGRCGSFTASCPMSTLDDGIVSCLREDAPFLAEVSLTCDALPPYCTHILPNSPHLHTISISGPSLSSVPFARSLSNVRTSHLRPESRNAHHLRSSLARLQNVTDLSITSWALACTTAFVLDCSHVETLEFVTGALHASVVQSFRFPNVHTAHIALNHTAPELTARFVSSSLSAVRGLHMDLKHQRVDDTLAGAIAELQSLEQLSFTHAENVHDAFFDALAHPAAGCPMLIKLVVQDCAASEGFDGASILRFARARREVEEGREGASVMMRDVRVEWVEATRHQVVEGFEDQLRAIMASTSARPYGD